MRTPWTLYDYVTAETYDLEINPNEGGSPSYEKTWNVASTSAPDGKVVIFEGRDAPKRVSVSGVLLTEDLYNAFVSWYDKRNLLRLTDDLGREFDIYIERFSPTRVRSVSHPWRHNYELSYIIVEGY
jgi:hypothetical protein